MKIYFRKKSAIADFVDNLNEIRDKELTTPLNWEALTRSADFCYSKKLQARNRKLKLVVWKSAEYLVSDCELMLRQAAFAKTFERAVILFK